LDERTPKNTRTSTITKSERAIFEKLFEKALAEPSTQRQSSSQELSSDKEAELGPKGHDVLDLILQRALKHHSANSARRDGSKSSSNWLSSLQDLAQNVQSRQAKKGEEESRLGPEQETQFLSKADVIRQREYKRVEKLILEANTDAELWDIMEKEVFTVIRALGLGEEEPADTRPDASSHEQPATFKDLMAAAPIEPSDHLHILGPNYPSILVLAMRQLRHEFPSSSLPLAVLPAMKALGRDAFVLGASTVLYNELIVFVWQKHADLHAICDLLQEMDNGVVDFDENTLDILDSIMLQVEQASKGRFGPAFKVMWNMDIFRRGAQKLTEWRGVVRTRMEADALRRANERQTDKVMYETALPAA
jgi:hypothetical protein